MRLCTLHHRATPTPHGRFLPLEYSRLQGAGRGKCSVSDLLSNFCGSLADQIDSRKYFYKSATLVREVPPLPAGTRGLRMLCAGLCRVAWRAADGTGE